MSGRMLNCDPMFVHVIKYFCSLELPAFFPPASPLEVDVRWCVHECVHVKEGETASASLYGKPACPAQTTNVIVDQYRIK